MVLPFFEPLHPAVRVHCNFCGTHITSDTYLTERVRNVRTLEKQGDYVFCEGCGERASELIGKVNDFRASLASKLNEEIEKSALEYAASLVPVFFSPNGAKSAESQDKPPAKSFHKAAKQPARKALPGEIPQPKSLNG